MNHVFTPTPVQEWHQLDEQQRRALWDSPVPLIVRGYVSHWPLVKAARQSFQALRDYLLGFDNGSPYQAMIAAPVVRGKLGYSADLSDVNFERMQGYLPDALDTLQVLSARPSPPTFYIGSSAVEEHLPGLERDNTLPCVAPHVSPNIWIGGPVTVATHNDDAENMACVAAGSRCFTLFPPGEEENLYIGPDDITPAGRPISLVDLDNPDLERFPRFRHALRRAQVADLQAGDALYIPTHWWHHVQSRGAVNILVNYWWQGAPPALA